MVDILLISPPVSNFGQAPAALPVLTAWLRSRGWNAHQWDLGIDVFHGLYSSNYLSQCRDELQRHRADNALVQLATNTARAIDDSKNALRTPMITADRHRMLRALASIEQAGVVLTSRCDGAEITDSKFMIHGAMNSFDSLARACTRIDDNCLLKMTCELALLRIAQLKPKTIGISVTYLSQLIPALALAHRIRQVAPNISLVLGGAYLTATSYELARTPFRTLSADAVIVQDGEVALDAWLRHVIHGETIPPLGNVYVHDGEGYRRGNGTVELSNDSVSIELDRLPVPMVTSEGLDLGMYLTPKYAHGVPLTRGCHWGKCVYCNISSQTSCRYRTRSVELAVRDIAQVVKRTGSNWFDFPVDSFRPRDLLQLATAVLEANLDIRWGAEVLLDGGFRDDLVKVLARSGCVCLRFGMESGCEQTLHAMNKATRPQMARRILGSCRAHGIRTAAMFIVGFPTETQSQLNQTFDFVVDNRDRIDFLTFHDYSLVIGSQIASYPGAFGLYLKSERAVFSPSLPFVNTNPGGMQPEQTQQVLGALRDALKPYYPDLGQLWTAGIGGWLTFAYCCENPL